MHAWWKRFSMVIFNVSRSASLNTSVTCRHRLIYKVGSSFNKRGSYCFMPTSTKATFVWDEIDHTAKDVPAEPEIEAELKVNFEIQNTWTKSMAAQLHVLQYTPTSAVRMFQKTAKHSSSCVILYELLLWYTVHFIKIQCDRLLNFIVELKIPWMDTCIRIEDSFQDVAIVWPQQLHRQDTSTDPQDHHNWSVLMGTRERSPPCYDA